MIKTRFKKYWIKFKIEYKINKLIYFANIFLFVSWAIRKLLDDSIDSSNKVFLVAIYIPVLFVLVACAFDKK